MNSCNSEQSDWKIVKFCSVGVAWKTRGFWTVCVQGMQHNIPWTWWNCSAGNTSSRHLLHFLLGFCHFVKKYTLQLQPFEGRKKLSTKVYWMWKGWFICRNAKLKLAQQEEKDWVFSWVVSPVRLAGKCQPSSRKEWEWEGTWGLGCLLRWQQSLRPV